MEKVGQTGIDKWKVAKFAIGMFCFVLAIFTFLSLFSFLFTWKKDQSLATDPELMANGLKAANWCGNLGFRWSYLLFVQLFGLGAFAIPFFFGVMGMFFWRVRGVRPLRWLFVTLLGAIVLSESVTFICSVFHWDNLFVSGAGGSYGFYVNRWLVSMLGMAGTAVLAVFLLVLWIALLNHNVIRAFDEFIDRTFIPFEPERPVRPAREPKPRKEKPQRKRSKAEPVETVSEEPPRDDEAFAAAAVSAVAAKPAAAATADGQNAPQQAYVDADGIPTEVDSDLSWIYSMPEDERKRLFDPRLELSRYQCPSLSLLKSYRDRWYEVTHEEQEENKRRIVKTLQSYKISVEKISVKVGPTVTLYSITLSEGIRIAQVRRLEEDIAVSLGAKGVRVITLADAIGIEVANARLSTVPLQTVLNSPEFKNPNMELPIALGLTVNREPFVFDLQKMPHLLIAGATGMGKSVGLNAIIASLLFTKHPAELKFVMVDPKKVELSSYSKLANHFLAMMPDAEEPIITETQRVIYTLKSLCIEMDNRYELLKMAGVRKIQEYNKKFLERRLNPQKGHQYLPYIVLIIDEFADLISTAGHEVEEPIARLAAKARAVGIHLIVATQRPTTDVITGTIKANFNSRIAFRVMSMVDSKTIIDQPGANRLIGQGDLLMMGSGIDLTRVQCAFIDTPEIDSIADAIASQNGYRHPAYLPEVPVEQEEGARDMGDMSKTDPLFEEAARIVVSSGQGSTSMLQRKLSLGYNRAGRIVDQLEAAGIVSPIENGRRTVLISDLDSLDRILAALNQAGQDNDLLF